MATTTVTLKHGLKLDDKPQLEAVLREPTAGDVIDATEGSEKVIFTGDGYELIASPTIVGSLVLCQQIVRIGEIEGPLTMAMLKKLSAADFKLLQDSANTLDHVPSEVTKSGESDQDGD